MTTNNKLPYFIQKGNESMMIVGGDGKFISIPDIKETRIKSTYAIIIKNILTIWNI